MHKCGKGATSTMFPSQSSSFFQKLQLFLKGAFSELLSHHSWRQHAVSAASGRTRALSSDPRKSIRWRSPSHHHHPRQMKSGRGRGGSIARGCGAAPWTRRPRRVQGFVRGSWGPHAADPAQRTLSGAQTAGDPRQDWTEETSAQEDPPPAERKLRDMMKT